MERERLLGLGLSTVSQVAAVLARGAQAAPPQPAAAAPPPAAAAAPPPSAAAAPAAVAAPKAAAAPAAAAVPAAKVSSSDTAKKTEHVFLSDSFLLSLADCELLEASLAAEPPQGAPAGHAKLTAVLNRTIFHPQGGGQQEQQVAEKWTAAVGKVRVACRVDESRRVMAARLHSAGHLLDAAVTAVGLKWIPGKGYHFPDGPYVEYILNEASRKIDPKKAGDKESVVREIQGNLDRLVASGGQVTLRHVDGVRHVAMAGEECPCGGTHVADITQIGHIEVKKLQNKQGNVRISYTVAAAA